MNFFPANLQPRQRIAVVLALVNEGESDGRVIDEDGRVIDEERNHDSPSLKGGRVMIAFLVNYWFGSAPKFQS